jgi:hypothetical protein
MPVIPTLGRQRQEGLQFKPDWAVQQDPVIRERERERRDDTEAAFQDATSPPLPSSLEVQTGLKLMIFVPQPSECWVYGCDHPSSDSCLSRHLVIGPNSQSSSWEWLLH